MTYHDIIIIPEILDISDHEIESIYILNFSDFFCRYILGDYITYISSTQLIFGGSFALMEVSFVLASSFM